MEIDNIELRDWFAGMVISGIYQNEDSFHLSLDKRAKESYELADAMLIERKKKKRGVQ